MYTSMKYARTRQGQVAQSKAIAVALKRKEEYLGARVPKELKKRVIDRAEELGIPVSILIRNTLADAFGGEEAEDKAEISHASLNVNDENAVGANKFPSVLGWEEIRLNRLAKCACCSKTLKPGSYVILGIAAHGEERIILCDICKGSL